MVVHHDSWMMTSRLIIHGSWFMSCWSSWFMNDDIKTHHSSWFMSCWSSWFMNDDIKTHHSSWFMSCWTVDHHNSWMMTSILIMAHDLWAADHHDSWMMTSRLIIAHDSWAAELSIIIIHEWWHQYSSWLMIYAAEQIQTAFNMCIPSIWNPTLNKHNQVHSCNSLFQGKHTKYLYNEKPWKYGKGLFSYYHPSRH